MQVRKLIRLLQEPAEKHGDRAVVMIDTRRYKDWKMDWTHDAVADVDCQLLPFYNPDEDGFFEHGTDRKVIVLNQE